MKLRTPLAENVERSLSVPDLRLDRPSVSVEQWVRKHHIRQIQPLFPQALKQKLQQHLTHREIVDGVARRFPERSRRRTGMESPDLLRDYRLEFTLPADASLADMMRELRADPNVEWVAQERLASVQLIPNDPLLISSNSWGQPYGDLYGHHQLSCPAAWDIARGAGVIVAVIDTGIDEGHSDIAANLWRNATEIPGNGIDDDHNGFVDDVQGWDFAEDNNSPHDGHGHGTHVAGTIAAVGNNSLGMAGVAWQARVMALKGLSDGGSGFDFQLAEAIVYAADNGADIINASWGGGGYSIVLEEAVDYATSLGVVFVAAAGNSSQETSEFFPANLTNAIAVSAVDYQDNKAGFSNFGTKVDVAAPGVDVLSLRATNTSLGDSFDSAHTRANGTSMAAPHVAGVAALLLSANGGYSPYQVRQALRVSADDVGPPGIDNDTGYGRVNARRILGLGAPLQARIQAPQNNSIVSGIVTIHGSANGPEFAGYTVEYGVSAFPSHWVLIETSSVAKVDSDLGAFDTNPFPDGIYTIRLRVYALSGSAFEDIVRIRVDYVFISDPPAPPVRVLAKTLKPGPPVSISGAATGPLFQRFRVDWARGVDPFGGWSQANLSITGQGTHPLTNTVLAEWDTRFITKADYYSVRLQVDNGSFTNEERTLVYFEPDLLSTNWPQFLDQGPDLFSSVLPMTTASGQTRLILANPIYLNTALSARLWSFSADGADRQVLPLAFGGYSQPAVGDLDGQPGEEIVVQDLREIRAVHSDFSFDVFRPETYLTFNFSPVTVEDLDGDGHPEILAVGTLSTNSFLFAWKPDGALLTTNFPIPLPGQYWATELDRAHNHGVLAIDLDGDGQKEILAAQFHAASAFRFRLFTAAGAPRTWPATSFAGQLFALATADLDHDGFPEIIFAHGETSPYSIEVLRSNGSAMAGWPRAVNTGTPVKLAVADLDRDGFSEIIVTGHASMHVLRTNGTPFPGSWPIEGDGFMPFGSVAVADIDGDGLPEILAHRSNVIFTAPPYYDPQLVAFRRDGSILRSWRTLGMNGNQPYGLGTTVIGDFDQNGKIDIALNYPVITGGGINGNLAAGILTVLTLEAPYRPHVTDWPMNHHDARNTATGLIPAKLQVQDLGMNTMLTWPVQPYPLALESAEQLAPSSWIPVSATISASNGLNRAVLARTNLAQFYRLRYR